MANYRVVKRNNGSYAVQHRGWELLLPYWYNVHTFTDYNHAAETCKMLIGLDRETKEQKRQKRNARKQYKRDTKIVKIYNFD